MKALSDMKKRFQGLIETYEVSNTELEDELKAKIEQASTLQVENEKWQSQLRAVEASLETVTEKYATEKKNAYDRQQDVFRLKHVIGSLESKIYVDVSEVRRNFEDVRALMGLLMSNSASEVEKNKALVSDAIKAAFSGIQANQAYLLQNSQKELLLEHKRHEEALSEAFNSELIKKTSEYTDTVERTKNDLISHFDKALQFSSPQKYVEKSEFKNDSALSAEKSHFMLVLLIKALLDSLVSASLIDSDAVVEVMQLISKSAVEDSTLYSEDSNSVSAGLLASNIHKLMKQKLDDALYDRDKNGSVVVTYKNEINSGKAKIEKLLIEVAVLSKEKIELVARLEDTTLKLKGLKNDISTLQELHSVELEGLTRNMRDKLLAAQSEYDSSTQNLRIEFIQKEADLKLQLDEATARSSESNSSKLSLLEAKLKSESTKRQSLVNRLAAEDSAHRKVVAELERRNVDLLRRLEASELEYTKLKLEKLHASFDEEVVETSVSSLQASSNNTIY